MVFGVIVAAVGQTQPVFSIFYTPEGNDSLRIVRQQAIIRRVADDHSFQLQCLRGAQQAGEEKLSQQKAAAANSAAAGTSLFGALISNSISAQEELHAPAGAKRSADSKPGKRQWGESGVCPENGMLEGVLLLPISSLFSTPKFVLWKRVDELLYAVVLDLAENCLLASNALTLFIHILADIFGVKTDSAPLSDLFLKRPDALLVTLHYLLPGGQLMFLNVSRAQRIKADVKDALRQATQGGKL
ncbi:hypothetical protein, conserved [Eimeria tenella]|uniref:Uncharacterized protein n=1 Tax=Eimeria tenella TaxID=5802 RepID=U6KWU9_EIMTE|nr:hypothetical protein, conserved [Eimeria tenella]CDJ42622.1 hypothetical protein, conserved [Eimeria tenella]|eukprot:XP_013233372.1 hypothetical protein, conserved [Eimeria tenella]